MANRSREDNDQVRRDVNNQECLTTLLLIDVHIPYCLVLGIIKAGLQDIRIKKKNRSDISKINLNTMTIKVCWIGKKLNKPH